MFTIYDDYGYPIIEVRRNPKCSTSTISNGILPPESTHIRLTNRTCYFDNAAELMDNFINHFNYIFVRISRIDICLDFETFDSGDQPNKFLQRYVAGKYSKINQCNIALHGLDNWDGRSWNSVKWGNTKSMITTKLYNKTMELTQKSDKPYIRQAWYEAGLIDDWHTIERYDKTGKPYKPEIWRLEFTIKSSNKNWFVVENPYNTKPKLRSIRHTLDQYKTRAQLMDVFLSLCDHYFHFKHKEYIGDKNDIENRQLKRKDRCRDKELFDKTTINTFYKLTSIDTNNKTSKENDRLLRYLYQYLNNCFSSEIRKIVCRLIEHLESITHISDKTNTDDEKTKILLRLLIAKRMKSKEATLEEDKRQIENLLQFVDTIY